MDEVAIKVEDVSKVFKLPREKHSSIKSAVVNVFRSRRGFELQRALSNVSFEVKKGEFFGVVGRNGSGKSTLLKLLAGIYIPTTGTIQVNGKLTPFIELGVGFNQELTGRENVYLNGALLGFSRKEMRKMYKDIVDFAELRRFMDQKLKNYSSGMQVRLAFSIAIRAQSDILLIDEVLAVGDAAFQRKCFNYFGDLKKRNQTVVFVSHDMASVRKYCDRVVLINDGVVEASGTPAEIVPRYLKIFMDEAKQADKGATNQDELPLGMSEMVEIDKQKISIDKVWLENNKGKTSVLQDKDEALYVKLSIRALKDAEKFVPGVIVANEQGEFITASNSTWGGFAPFSLNKGERATISFQLPNIYEKGDYKISVNAVSEDLGKFYDWKNEVSSLSVEREYQTGAKAFPKYKVSLEKNGK